jgi:hypothetical protein
MEELTPVQQHMTTKIKALRDAFDQEVEHLLATLSPTDYGVVCYATERERNRS